jgi:hypothetical protein
LGATFGSSNYYDYGPFLRESTSPYPYPALEDGFLSATVLVIDNVEPLIGFSIIWDPLLILN